ncbi:MULTISPECIES: transmembrane glucosamine N-acetyltransferase NagX [unclassified Shewanella]|uniref:transmembrane glucosamine N-acetyltransferase NagX n=1 Tax=unclassified Shewanella TaxID=196818 RepID=UPI003FA77FB0
MNDTRPQACSNEKKQKVRLKSLDALRGFDMFWILGGEAIFAGLVLLTGWSGFKWLDAQMHHSPWHGFTFYDLIFPLFIFLSGVALGLSPKRLDKLPMRERMPLYQHGIKRLALLLLLGMVYNHGWGTGFPMALGDIRYASVLGRIAFAWFFCALLVWHTSLRTQVILTIAILVGYSLLQLFPFLTLDNSGAFTATGSINAAIDSLLLPGVIYQDAAVDPEGILSTIPAVVNGLFGVFVGHFIVKSHVKGEGFKVAVMTTLGLALLGIGWLISPIIPVNKTLWTSSFVLVTSGWSLLLLALFYGVIDVMRLSRWAFPFIVIGCNAIVIYLATSIVNWQYTADSLFGGVIKWFPVSAQSLIAVIALLLVQWLVLYWMYKRSIFIKV